MRRRGDAGSSALELLISVTIFVALVGSLTEIFRSYSATSSQFRAQGSLDEKAWRVTDLIRRELRWAQGSTLLVTSESGSGRLDFRTAAGFVGGATTFSSTITIKYVPSVVDANHDHKVNEGSIVRIEDGRARVLCDFVPIGGFVATLQGADVALDLTLSVSDDHHRTVRARSTVAASARN